MPDYNFKPTGAFSNVLDLVANQRLKEQQIKESQQNVQKSKVDMIRGIAQDGATMASTMVSTARENEKRSALKELATLYSQGSQPVPAPGTLPEGGIGPNPQPIPMAQTPQFQSQAQSLLFKAAPEAATKELAQQMFPNGPYGASSKGQQARYLDENGIGRIGTYDPLLKKVIMSPDDPVQAYSPSVITDPFNNRPYMAPKSPGAQPTPIEFPQDASGSGENDALIKLRRANPKVAADIEKIRAKAFPQNNPALKDSIEAASSAGTVRDIVSDPNPSQVALAGLGFHLARMSGSNSQLSDAEREIFQEPLSFLRKIENKGWKFVAGDLSPKMKQDLKKLALTLERKSQRQAKIQINGVKLQAKGTAGGYWTNGLEGEFPGLDELIAMEKVTAQPESEMDVDEDALDAELKARGL